MTDEEIKASNEQSNKIKFFADYPGYGNSIIVKDTAKYGKVSIDATGQLIACKPEDGITGYDTKEGDCNIGFMDLDSSKMGPDKLNKEQREIYENVMKMYTDQDPYSLYAKMYMSYADNDEELLETVEGADWVYNSIYAGRMEINSKADSKMFYESNEIIGFIIKLKAVPNSYVCFFYRKDDLNQCYSIMLHTSDDETAYGMINSIKIEE